MIIIYIVILLFMAIISMAIYRDIMCPAVLQSIPWAISIALLSFTNFDYISTSYSYVYIIIGSFVFQIGFSIAINNINLKNRFKETNTIFKLKVTIIKFFILFEMVFLVCLYFTLYQYIKGHFVINVFTSLKLGYNNRQIPFEGVFDYLRNIISVITICMVILYFFIEKDQKKNYKKLLIIQVLIELLNIISIISRNSMLLVAVSILCIIILCKNINNRVTVKYLFRSIIAFLAFFSCFAFYKYSYLFEGQSRVQIIINQISLYSSGSLVAFEKYFNSPNNYFYGQNTFRFFVAIYDGIFGSSSARDIVQNFAGIGQNLSTNVYTFYHYYACDFGLVYALLVQFVVGVIHGISYKKLQRKTPLSIFLFSILMYPLLMQFFQDQYISILSNWIQFIIIALIFFKSNIFLVIRREK